MRKILFVIIATLPCVASLLGQTYNEEEIKKQLEKYAQNPKLYYDKIKSLNERAEKANENTLKVSEEYLTLLDKKDSLLKIYKQRATVASKVNSATPSSQVTTGSPVNPSQQTTTIVTKVKGKTELTPYRVQLAAYFKEDFEKFFGTFNKTLGIQKLNNRNVIEVQGFADESEAMEFSQKIQKLGFPGAFVTKYDENGNRQEEYAANKSDTKMGFSSSSASPAPKVSKKIEYPDYIPVGYKEILSKKQEATTTASIPPVKVIQPPAAASEPQSATNTPKARSAEPITLKAPQINRKSILSDNAPSSSSSPTIQKPKTLANITPPTPPKAEQSAAKPVPPASTPAVNRNTRDQLDAAFDQLFKR